jgi:hypothetical protein
VRVVDVLDHGAAAFTPNREECIAHVRGPQRIQSDKFIDQRPPQHRR